MQRAVAAVLAIGLVCSGAATVLAQEPSAPGPVTQRIEVPAYGVSIRVPGDWVVDEPYRGMGDRLHPTSGFTSQLAMQAWQPEGATWCNLTAWSRPTRDAPVDTLTEAGSTAGIS